MKNILKFKPNIPSQTKFYERTAEEDVIYKHHLKIKTKPEDFTKFLPKTSNEELYKIFFLYYTDWHRLYCKDAVCKAPSTMNYCSSYSTTAKHFMKNLFYLVNQPRLIKND